MEAPAQIGSLEPSVDPALVLIVATERDVAVPWLQAIQKAGPLCIWTDSPARVERSLAGLTLGAAVVDLVVPHASDLVPHLTSQGVKVLAVDDAAQRRIAAFDRGCYHALPRNSLPDEISRAVIRALRSDVDTTTVRGDVASGPLMMSCTYRRALWHGEEVRLGRTLFNLLGFLGQHPRQPFRTRELLARVWMDPYKSEGTVWTAIKKLRVTLQDHGHIVNWPGFGYCFIPEEPVGVTTAEPLEAGSQAS